MKQSASAPPKTAVLSLAQLLAEQPAAPPPGWIEPGLLPPSGILFVGGEPKVGKSLLVANLALALAAGKDRAGFRIPAARRAQRWNEKTGLLGRRAVNCRRWLPNALPKGAKEGDQLMSKHSRKPAGGNGQGARQIRRGKLRSSFLA